jgi:4a-hydroxytetrahydrobiopterin dehydratase
MDSEAFATLGTPVVALTEDEIRRELAGVPAWQREGDRLVREFAFANFDRTMAFVNAVAWVAHAEDHHPDLLVSYARCRVEYSTHDCNGLSQRDFNCARQLDQLYARRA